MGHFMKVETIRSTIFEIFFLNSSLHTTQNLTHEKHNSHFIFREEFLHPEALSATAGGLSVGIFEFEAAPNQLVTIIKLHAIQKHE